MNRIKSHIFILILFIFALSLRLYGLNWDQDQHLHPDERFLTMVLMEIKIPQSIGNYFNTTSSPLNPYNYPNYQFFVYGTFPVFVTKVISILFNLETYHQITLLGRSLSAISDSFIVVFLYLISRLFIKPKSKFVYLASFLYATTVLPLQLSHFFAVDTFLNLFLTASLYFCLLFHQKRLVRHSLLSALFFGLALCSKITALYFAPLFFLLHLFPEYRQNISNFSRLVPLALAYFLVFVVVFRIAQPYAFSSLFQINPQFIDNLTTLRSLSSPDVFFPPSVQWLSITPLLFSLKNLVFYGLGLPLSLVFLSVLFFYKKFAHFPQKAPIFFIFLFALLYLLAQSLSFAPALRYFLPIYPIIIFISSYFLSLLNFPSLTKLLVIYHFLSAFFFLSIYSRPHSRIQASEWIYQNIPTGSTITNEYWDDPLPLYLSNHDPNIYQGIMLPLYDPDSQQKWASLKPQIDSADFIIMSSNRLWGSIPKVPQLYPQTSQFYRDLFNHQTKFNLMAKFTSYPGISLPFLSKCYYLGPTNYPSNQNSWFEIDPNCYFPGIYLRDDTADESFTVYDHPQVLIFSATTQK